jgi:hypothetical protein
MTTMRTRSVAAAILELIAALGLGQRRLERAAAAHGQNAAPAPFFQVNPLWPNPDRTTSNIYATETYEGKRAQRFCEKAYAERFSVTWGWSRHRTYASCCRRIMSPARISALSTSSQRF